MIFDTLNGALQAKFAWETIEAKDLRASITINSSEIMQRLDIELVTRSPHTSETDVSLSDTSPPIKLPSIARWGSRMLLRTNSVLAENKHYVPLKK
jgi:hypothetical protein